MSKKFIAFTGPGSSGKTTLINSIDFKKILGEEVFMINSHTRDLKSKGFPINAEGSSETQINITIRHYENVNNDLGQTCIFDRCVLDGFVYTKWLRQSSKIRNYVLRFAEGVYHDNFDKYDIVFYCKADFDYVDDKDRDIPFTDREIIKKIYDTEIAILQNLHYNKKTKIVELTGTVEERKKTVEKVLDNLK